MKENKDKKSKEQLNEDQLNEVNGGWPTTDPFIGNNNRDTFR